MLAETLHIPTLSLLTGGGSLLGAAILFWLGRDQREPAAALAVATFAAATLAVGLGFLSFFARDVFAAPWAPQAGYLSLGAAAVLTWIGTQRLFDRAPRISVGGFAFAGFAATVVALGSPQRLQAIAAVVVTGSFVAAFMGLAAAEARRTPWFRQLRSVRLMHGLLVLNVAIVALRMVVFLLDGGSVRLDGTTPAGSVRTLFALLYGAIPFAITVTVLSVANSRLSARLHRMATTDDLTGLVSRRSLQESAERLLGRPAGAGCIALLMIDVDRFKTVNDRHGHGVGDQVLRHAADVLRHSLRPDSLIVRYGGDEFCALVPVPGEAAAFVVAERLRATMEASPFQLEDGRIPVTLSIGVTVHRHGATLRHLLDEADRRAYRAKAEGRNRVVAEDAA